MLLFLVYSSTDRKSKQFKWKLKLETYILLILKEKPGLSLNLHPNFEREKSF